MWPLPQEWHLGEGPPRPKELLPLYGQAPTSPDPMQVGAGPLGALGLPTPQAVPGARINFFHGTYTCFLPQGLSSTGRGNVWNKDGRAKKHG